MRARRHVLRRRAFARPGDRQVRGGPRCSRKANRPQYERFTAQEASQPGPGARLRSVIGISLDGSTEAMHRAMRGARADFWEAVRAAELVARQPGTRLKLATVVSAVNRDDLPRIATLVQRYGPDVWRLYQYSARGAQNIGQQRHQLPDSEFRELAAAAAHWAAPVSAAASTEALTAGCLIVTPEGIVLEPVKDRYLRHGSCLDEPLDEILGEVPGRAAIATNKRWLTLVTEG